MEAYNAQKTKGSSYGNLFQLAAPLEAIRVRDKIAGSPVSLFRLRASSDFALDASDKEKSLT